MDLHSKDTEGAAGAGPADSSHTWPIVTAKDYSAPSVFRPEALLREARRQKQLPLSPVPEVCVLDPDGDVVRHLNRTSRAQLHEGWACYHTELLSFDLDGFGEIGIVGCAVGASFATLVAWPIFEESHRNSGRPVPSHNRSGQEGVNRRRQFTEDQFCFCVGKEGFMGCRPVTIADWKPQKKVGAEQRLHNISQQMRQILHSISSPRVQNYLTTDMISRSR